MVLKYYQVTLRNYCSGWPGGWLDQMEIRLNSASVEVEAELGNDFHDLFGTLGEGFKKKTLRTWVFG